MAAHAQLLEKARTGGIDIYFIGDSITRRWGATDYPDLLANWRQNFFGWNAADFGWGADKTQNILWRLENGELDGVNPRVIVILAGTNNVGAEPADAAKVQRSRGTDRDSQVCQQKAPQATIILTAIFPRNDNPRVPSIDQINANIARLADGEGRYLNVNSQLADKDGRLFEGMMNERDKLHPTFGVSVGHTVLNQSYRVLGPPASTDHAPPPTGDPSVRSSADRPKVQMQAKKSPRTSRSARRYSDVLTTAALDAMAALEHFDADRRQLMQARIERRQLRARERERISFLPADATIGRTAIRVSDARAGRFDGSDIPADLRRQWIQGTGPAARPRATTAESIRSVAYALLSGADGWMFDGEDALGQVDSMSLDNQRNLRLAFARDAAFMAVAEQVASEMNAWAQKFFGRPTIEAWRTQLDFTSAMSVPDRMDGYIE